MVTHRFISSGQDLEYYVKYPDGIIWKDPHLAGIDVFYLATHGKPGGLITNVKDLESEELIQAFNGLDRYFNIVYFSGCEVLGGKKGQTFVKEFLKKTGTIAVVGYTEKTYWVDSIIIDTLFLSRFLGLKNNRFAQIQKVYDSVIRNFRKAKKCGFKLFLNEPHL